MDLFGDGEGVLSASWPAGGHPGRDLRALIETQLIEDTLNVAFGCGLSDKQCRSDLAIREALDDQRRHFTLPAGEGICRRSRFDLT